MPEWTSLTASRISVHAMHQRSIPSRERWFSTPLRMTNLVDRLLISTLLIRLLERRPHSRKSRNMVHQSSDGSVVISMPRTSSGIDSGGDSERELANFATISLYGIPLCLRPKGRLLGMPKHLPLHLRLAEHGVF